MYKNRIIRGLLFVMLSLYGSVCVWAASPQEQIPVRIRLGEFSIEPVKQEDSGKKHESNPPLQMSFGLELIIPSSCCVGKEADHQELALTDSLGHLLVPVRFNLEWLMTEGIPGTKLSLVRVGGIATELPSDGSSWLSMNGKLLIPLGVEKESPVHELPLKEGSQVDIPLPMEQEDRVVDEDIAEAKEEPSGILSLQKLEHVERDGKKMLCVRLSLRGTVPCELERLELVNKDGLLLDLYRSISGSSSQSSSWRIWRIITFEPWEGMDQLRVKLIYKSGVKNVAVPVDMKIGLGGAIPPGK